MVDEFKIYDRALSAAEILSGYQAIANVAVAVNDTYFTPMENGLAIAAPGVLANDSGAIGAFLVEPPAHGTLTLSEAGGFIYTPSDGFIGIDTFTYRPSEIDATDVATVSIDVTRPVAAILPPGAIAWWKGEDNAEDRIGAYDGTLAGNATFGAGKVGRAFDLDGMSQIVVPDSPTWAFGPGGFTINLWANFRSHVFDGTFLDQSDANSRWAFWRVGDSFEFYIHPPDYPGYGITVQPVEDYQFDPTPGRWYNIAYTASGAGSLFYVDGILVGTNGAGGPINPNGSYPLPDVAGPLVIGGAIDGLIDEVMLYNRALTPTEIRAIYNAASAGLVVYAEDGAQSIEGWAQTLYPGLPPGGSEDISFQTNADMESLFLQQPQIDSSGTLTFTPAPNSQGTTTVTVVLHDNRPAPAAEGEGPPSSGGEEEPNATQTFTIEIVQLHPGQNDVDPLDSNNDANVSPIDGLIVINYLNEFGTGLVAPTEARYFRDSSGDDWISSLDLLLIFNHLNATGGGGDDGPDGDTEPVPEGEGEGIGGRGSGLGSRHTGDRGQEIGRS